MSGQGDVLDEPPGFSLLTAWTTSCPGLLSPVGNLKPLRKKRELLQHLPRLGFWGMPSKVGQTRDSPPFLPCSIFPYVFFHRDHKRLRHFPASLEVSMFLQMFVPVIYEAQTQMSKPLCWCLPDTTRSNCVSHQPSYIFYIFSIFNVSSSYIFFSLSFIPKWIFQLISHLLYLPSPLAHFSSSPSSCLFSFFSYNPVHLDNFHLNCLT